MRLVTSYIGLIIFTMTLSAQEFIEAAGVYRGLIANKYPFQMEIKKPAYDLQRAWTGHYFYESVGTPIELIVGDVTNGQWEIAEFVNNEKTGMFRIAFDHGRFQGTWTSPTGKSLAVEARQVIRYYYDHILITDAGIINMIRPEMIEDGPLKNEFNAIISIDIENKFKEAVVSLEDWTSEGESSLWEYYRSYTCRYVSDNLVSFLIEWWTFTGGAHGNTSYETVNMAWIDGSTKPIEWRDMFNGSDYIDRISDLGMGELRKKEADYVISGEITTLNDNLLRNFTISPTGIILDFAPYEVAPYAGGPMSIMIPYTSLKDIINRSGPLGKFIQKK